MARSRRREPVAEVGEAVHRQPQAVLRAELGERALAAVQRAAPGLRARAASDGSARRSARRRARRARAAGRPPRSTREPRRRSSRARPAAGRAAHWRAASSSPAQQAWQWRSPASTMPPGKTQAPLLWSPRSARRSSSTSMPTAASRTTTSVAAARGARGRLAGLAAVGRMAGFMAVGAIGAVRPPV